MSLKKGREAIPLNRASRLIEEDIKEVFVAGSDRWDSRILVSLPAGPFVKSRFGIRDTVNVYIESVQRFCFNTQYHDAQIQSLGAEVMAAVGINQTGE
jgi:hypothetical protein